MTSNHSRTLIIGAGPAGLAVAGALTRRGLPCTVLEQSQAVGAAWRNHYDRLHLHTDKATSALPHLPFPANYPTYPSREQVAAYLDDYAHHFGIQPRFGERVQHAGRRDGRWEVRTTNGTHHADVLIVATGYNAQPIVPQFPGVDKFRGATLHSSAYRNPKPHLWRRTLVIGCGNSGAEIALDLAERGVETTLAIRSPIHVIPRDLGGVPFVRLSILMSRFPIAAADALAVATLRLAVGDLRKYGIRRPTIGPNRLVEKYGRVSLIDVGTLAAIKQGRIKTAPGVDRFTPTGVRFVDGRSEPFDDVIFATGYRAGLERFLEDADRLTNDRGAPLHHGREVDATGLYFLGFRNPIGGMLREIRREALRIADDLRRKNGR